ncbi:MAG: glycosyltransferase family 2 protein [Bacteroidota bacterium]
MRLPRVSLVIVTWNGLSLLQRCLPSVMATDYENLEVILADNASTDGTADWVAAAYPQVRIVRHPENWAFCRGNNEAVPHTTGRYVLLLNNDVAVPPGWLRPLVDAMEADPALGAVQPKLLQHDDHTLFEYAGAAGGFLDQLGYPFTRGRVFFTMESDRGQYDAPRDIFWATGAALMLRRTAIDEVGLLDEQFVLHMEEIDLCWRLWRHGWRVRALPQSEVYHIGGASLPQGTPQKAYYNFRNSLLMLYKNLPPSRWRRVFPQRLALDGLAAVRALAAGKPREAAAILRAYADAHRLKDRYTAQRPPEGTPPPPFYRGRIVLDYFARGRQRFSDLPADRLPPGGEGVRV